MITCEAGASVIADSEEAVTLSLLETVRQARQGDESAQRTLIVSYQRRVAGFIYAIVGYSHVVEDLAQIVFIKMVRSLPRLHDPALFEAWLFRTARNACIDHLRRQRLQRIFVPFEPEHTEVAEAPGGVDMEEFDALRHALAQLRPADRELLAMAQERRSHVEMAEVTGTTVMIIKARLYRARERLREYYQPSQRHR